MYISLLGLRLVATGTLSLDPTGVLCAHITSYITDLKCIVVCSVQDACTHFHAFCSKCNDSIVTSCSRIVDVLLHTKSLARGDDVKQQDQSSL